MKKFQEYEILSNKEIHKNIYELIVEGDIGEINPGQFVNIEIPNKYLLRPFSVAYYEQEKMHIIYKVVGSGTEILAKIGHGERLKILTGLGNGFDLEEETKKPLLVGGGTGVAPIYYLACKLIDKGINPTLLLGFKNQEESIYLDRFQEFSNCFITYEDHSKYRFVTDYMKEWNDAVYDYYYACGPKGMLKAVSDMSTTEGEMSLESRMGCGVGQCKCCSIKTNEGMKTLCKDGPVLKKRLVKW